MQTIRVNGYDMPYLEVGHGQPLVCVHGTLGDFRTWYAVLGPLSKKHRVIAVSLRHFFPEHWDGAVTDYRMAQHVSDIIGFIEQITPRPVDLMGHSRGGHLAFRIAQQRPDLLRKLVLAEPGGDLDARSIPPARPRPVGRWRRGSPSPPRRSEGRHRGGAGEFRHGSMAKAHGGACRRRPSSSFATTSSPCSARCTRRASPTARPKADIRTPTLLIGGGDTTGALATIWRVLADHIADAKTATIPGGRHWMFENNPEEFCRVVMQFLAD